MGGFPAATPAAPYLGGDFPGGGNGRWPVTRWSKYVWSGGESLAFEPPTSGEGLDTAPLLPGLPCAGSRLSNTYTSSSSCICKSGVIVGDGVGCGGLEYGVGKSGFFPGEGLAGAGGGGGSSESRPLNLPTLFTVRATP